MTADPSGSAQYRLRLEVKETPDLTPIFGGGVAMMTPAIDEDYWCFRVRLSDKQAILGFGKFGTIGIGFAQEEDWNSNLPASVHTSEILAHILHNKGDDSIPDDDVREAIRMVQRAAATYLGRAIEVDDNGDLRTATADGTMHPRYER